MKNLMWKLLRKHISATQLVGFGLANLVGLTIVILAVQFYCDVQPIFNDEESFIKRDYVVITRKVSGLGSIMGESSEFNNTALEDLQSQPWVRKVGQFASSEYNVDATIGLGGGTLHSQLFFESIPNEFIDINPAEWEFNPENPEIPVIVSKDYLSLYNFGFASAQGMPQLSESMIGMIPLNFRLSGNGMSETLPGRIVGFSNRLNTILVPEEFMEWSNEQFGRGGESLPSRLIVEVNAPGDSRIKEYMDSHNYDIAGDKLDSSKANYFLTVIIGIVIAVGVLISVLSFFILMLSIYLLLQKNTKKLQDLLLLGYTTSQVSQPYVNLVICVNSAVALLAVVLMVLCRSFYMPMLSAFKVDGASLLWSVIVAIVIMATISLGNIIAIKRKISTLWHQ